MKHWLGVAGAGLALFVLTVLGLLAAQGRLDYEGTRGVPVLSWFFTPPPMEVEPSDQQAAPPASQDPQAPAPMEAPVGPAVDPGATPGLETVQPAEAGLFRHPTLESGMTVADLEEILRNARRMEDEARRRMAAVEEREADLGIRERDLADRERAIATSMMDVDATRERLDERIKEFEERVLLVEKDEIAALLRFGRSLASFEPSRAAQLVLQEWGSDVGRKRVTKVLTLMDSDDADRILSRIPDDKVRDVLIERLDVVLEPERR